MPDRIEYRTIAVEPISDLIAICELIPEFGPGNLDFNADSFAALELAKAALANRHPWTGEPIPTPTEATPATDLKSAASSLALRYQEDRRVVCVGVRGESIAVMINRTKRTRHEIPSTWQGWPVETVDHGPFAVVGGDPNA